MFNILSLISQKPFRGVKIMRRRTFLILLFVLAPLLSGPQTAFSKDPIYFDLDQIRIQYYRDRCGYRMVAINIKLEYYDLGLSGRLQRFQPKIMSVLFLRLSEYFNKIDRPSNDDLKRILRRSIDGVVGEDVVNDILILDVIHV